MIDLHLHTTASDGTESPAELVRACREKGLTLISVTDHDTTAALPAVAAEAHREGLGFVPGIELTSVWCGRDIHVLGYFIEDDSPELRAFLEAQLDDRVRRARAVGERLTALGAPVDMEALVALTKGRPLGRPLIADAMVEAGHVKDRDEAFLRFLGDDRPAYVARQAASPAEVIALVRRNGGVSSLAHPGFTKQDDVIPLMVDAGLDAIEVYHSDHSDGDTARYRALAHRFGLAVTGGSDYHGAGMKGSGGFGVVSLPAAEFEGLQRRADARRGGQ
jgi:3',5'-nucleoside bisphosphate phosphatase